MEGYRPRTTRSRGTRSNIKVTPAGPRQRTDAGRNLRRGVSRFWMSQKHLPGCFVHLKCAPNLWASRGSFKAPPNVSFYIKFVLIPPSPTRLLVCKFHNVTVVFSLALASLLSTLPLVPPPHLLCIIGFSSGASVYIFGVCIVSFTASRKLGLCKLI